MQPTVRSCPMTLPMLEVLAVTVTLAVVECVSVPNAPVTVSINVEGVMVGRRLTVSVEEPGDVTEPGLKDADPPVGAPVTLKPTAELNPKRELTATEEEAEPPTLTVIGEMTPREKSVTVTVNAVAAWFPCASVALQVTVVMPVGKFAPEAGEQVTGSVPSTKSVAVGLVYVTSAPVVLVATTTILG